MPSSRLATATRVIALILVFSVFWTGLAVADVQFMVIGQPVPGDGIWMPTLSAEKLVEDLRDRDKMRASLLVKDQELANLRQQLANKDAQITQLEAAIAAEKEAWIRADEREKIRETAELAMKKALEVSIVTSEQSISFMKQQQEEINSLRRQSIWLMVFGGLAAIGFGVLAFIK